MTEHHDVRADPARIERFLRALYGTADGGFLALWILKPGNTSETAWVPITDLALAASLAAEAADAGNQVYFGVGLHPAPLGSGRRGAEAGVCGLPGLFADVDFGTDGHTSLSLPPTLEDALAILAAIPIPPTIIVFTGHGIHAYWLFPEVFAIDTLEERAHLRNLNDRLQAMLRAGATAHGWSLDPTADLARVLRPPGTVNGKPGHPPVLVRNLPADGPRTTADELDDLLPPLPHNRAWSAPQDAGDRGESDRPDARLILSACAYLRHIREDAAALPEPEWHAGFSILALCQDGEDLAHAISRPYPRYTRAETQQKFERARAEDKPMTCATIRYDRGGEAWCQYCPLPRWITSPIELGYRPATVVTRGTKHSANIPSRGIPLRHRGRKESSRRGFQPVDLVNGRVVER